jgi:hypothetical protein
VCIHIHQCVLNYEIWLYRTGKLVLVMVGRCFSK